MVLISAHLLFRFYEYRFPPEAPVEVVEWTQYEIAGAHTEDGAKAVALEGSSSDLKPFVFEETDSAQFVGMGLSPKTAASLLRFRDRGGEIQSLKDWYALRVLSDEEKQRIAPYVQIRESERNGVERTNMNAQNYRHNNPTNMNAQTYGHNNPTNGKRPYPGDIPQRQWSVQDLNRSDSADWDAIPGVGPATARRIIEYRDRLGGFLRLPQLLEIYGMDSARYEAILPFVRLDEPTNIRRISLNRCSESELSAHPYAGRTLARRLIAFRERHGSLPPPDSLRTMRLYGVDAERLNRLLPYLIP